MIPKLSWWAIGAMLLASALASLSWQMTVDSPLLAYTALAIDRFGLVPYRDIIDFNTPGAYLANIAIGRLFGYSEIGFRIADVLGLAVILGATAFSLRHFGWRVSAAAALLFGFSYLGLGPVMSLQREYLLLVPISLAIAVALHEGRAIPRAAGVGVLIGIAATIKPQSAVLLPAFLGWMIWTRPADTGRIVLPGMAGFVMPIAAATWWLWSAGAWPAFIDMASNYWPLYNELTGIRPARIVSGGERWWWNAQRFFLSRDLRHLLVIPAIAGAWFALYRAALPPPRRRDVVLLVAIFVALQLYPLIAGKFWGYHWLPALYGASVLAALCFSPAKESSPIARDFVAAMTVVMITALAPDLIELSRNVRRVRGEHVSTATQIAGEISKRLRPGDTVQPLDATSGAVHALFLTQTRLATPFLYDLYFYHHVSHPYIQSMRARLIRDLDAARPALVVDADLRELFEGPNTSNQFPELSNWLRQHYRAVVANDRFVIYERLDQFRRLVE